MSEDMNRFILDKLEKVDDKLEEVRVKYSHLEQSFKAHEHLDEKIHDSVETMSKDLNDQMTVMCESIEKYNLLLQEHMRRTEIAEKNILTLNDQVAPMFAIYKERNIISTYKSKTWKSYTKWIAGITTVSGAIIALAKVFELF